MIYHVFFYKRDEVKTVFNGAVNMQVFEPDFCTKIREIEADSPNAALWKYIKLYQKDIDLTGLRSGHIIAL